MDNTRVNKEEVRPSYQWVRWYLVKTPWWMKRLWPSYIWGVDTREKIVYLTFDDGPHPMVTPFVLEELEKYKAKATFFCIGKNVLAQPELYQQILGAGHAVGNHTHRHLNGWKTSEDIYLTDVADAAHYIDSHLFRPPYGRITRFQAKNLPHAMKRDAANVIMWSVLSGDFDTTVTRERCLQNVILNTGPGSIVVFHDSEKAFPVLQYVLPEVLRFFDHRGYRFEKL